MKDIEKLACKQASTPIEPNHKLGKAKDDVDVDKEMYQRFVGRLIYLSHTKPDIAHVVSVISQFMHNPKEVHLHATYRVLHYFKGTLGKGIFFKKNVGLILKAYMDVDYARSIVEKRSTTKYCTFLVGT